MKRFFLLSAIALISFGGVNAQAANNQQTVNHNNLPQVRAKNMVSGISKVCGLHGDQFTKVNNACVTYFTNYDALQKEKATLSSDDYAAKLAALQNTRNLAIRASLGTDQQQQFETYLQQNKGN